MGGWRQHGGQARHRPDEGVRDPARERARDDAINHRVRELLERGGCDWVEAWTRAITEQVALGRADRDPHRRCAMRSRSATRDTAGRRSPAVRRVRRCVRAQRRAALERTDRDPARAGDGAHTTGPDGRHGADIPLRRVDNPGGKTIEGRLFGDPPWARAERASIKWLSDTLMVRVLNEYIRTNWDQIRTDLALNGEHAGGGDAGSAIGEGQARGPAAAGARGRARLPKVLRPRLGLGAA